MTWRQGWPDEPGFYWHRRKPEDVARIVELVAPSYLGEDYLVRYAVGSDYGQIICANGEPHMDWYCGPLERPKEG